MPEEGKKVTGGEMLTVFGNALIKAGELLDDDGKLSKADILKIVQETIVDVWQEYND